MSKPVQFAALWRQVAPPAIADYWAPIIDSVGQLAARRPEVATPGRQLEDWAFPKMVRVSQLAARRLHKLLPFVFTDGLAI